MSSGKQSYPKSRGRRGAPGKRQDRRRAELGTRWTEENDEPDFEMVPPPPRPRATRQTEATRPREDPPSYQSNAPNRYVGLSDPLAMKRHLNETYYADHHGYMDLCRASYCDTIEFDSRLANALSEAEFLLVMSWLLYYRELTVRAFNHGLNHQEATCLTFLQEALPQAIPIPEEVFAYLQDYGHFETPNCVGIVPGIVLPEMDPPRPGEVPDEWRASRVSPAVIASTLGFYTGQFDGETFPYAGVNRVTTQPGGHAYRPPSTERSRTIQGRTIVTHGDTPGVRFQISQDTLADYVGFMSAVSLKKPVKSGMPQSTEGSLSQLVISVPIGYREGMREVGTDYLLGSQIDVSSAQKGRLFRYQRLVPRALTTSGLDGHVDHAYNQSTPFARLQTVSLSRVEILQPFLAIFARNHRV